MIAAAAPRPIRWIVSITPPLGIEEEQSRCRTLVSIFAVGDASQSTPILPGFSARLRAPAGGLLVRLGDSDRRWRSENRERRPCGEQHSEDVLPTHRSLGAVQP